jgi:hypothetical protein
MYDTAMFVPSGAAVVLWAADVAAVVELAGELELPCAPASDSSVPAQPVMETTVASSRAAGNRREREAEAVIR